MRIIGEFWEGGYVIRDVDTQEELYRASSEDSKGHKASMESLKLWCEQTGQEMAEAFGATFLGVEQKE